MTSASPREAPPLPLHLLLMIGVLAVAIIGQGGYYGPVQGVLALGLALGVLAAVHRRGLDRSDLRGGPVAACAALATWALVRATIGANLGDGGGYLLLLAGVAAVWVICGRTTWAERELLLDAVIGLAVVAALSGVVGVAWHASPWGLERAGIWRAATTLTYANAAAGVLVPIALLTLGRLAARPRSPILAATACIICVGAGATLSRAGVLAFAVGATALAGLIGPRRFARAAGPALLGAAIALAGLLPSMVDRHPAPAVGVLALGVGLVVATFLARRPSRALSRASLVLALAGTIAIGAGAATGGAFTRITASRLSFASPGRTAAGAAALRLVDRHPLAGVGPRRATLAWTGRRGETLVSRYAHDEYLQVLAELGVIGLALLVGLIAAIALQLWRARRWAASPELWAGVVAALVAAAVHGGFDYLWHVPAVVLVCAALAAVTGSTRAETAVAVHRSRVDRVGDRQTRGVLT